MRALSTGGFTDVLLQHGAASVVALDVGHGQLHERLRADDRVEVLERTNLRHVDPTVLGPFDAVVADLSFISLTVVMQVLVDCCADDGWLVLLVKPQFEAGRREASKGRGVIVDPAQWRGALERVAAAAIAAGARVDGLCRSPLHGADGNVEFLLLLRPDRAAADPAVAGAGLPDTVVDLIDDLVPMPVDDETDQNATDQNETDQNETDQNGETGEPAAPGNAESNEAVGR